MAKMNPSVSGIFATLLFFIMIVGAHAKGWEPAPFPSETAKSVQGCADKFSDDFYVCAYVRCDTKGALGFYIAAPGADVVGDVILEIDGQNFPATFRKDSASALQFANKAANSSDAFFAALKSGTILKIKNGGLKAGFDIIRLQNAGPQISRIEKTCDISSAVSPPVPAATSTAKPPEPPPAAQLDRETALRKIAEGEEFCRKNLNSAPKDLKLGEIGSFCQCMGVQETALSAGGLQEDAKSQMRPNLQQMCVGIIRNQTQGASQAPNQTSKSSEPAPAAPVLPSSPGSDPQSAAKVVGFVAKKGRMPFEGNWRLRTSPTCDTGYSVSKSEIIERLPTGVRSFRISSAKRQNEMVYTLTIVGMDNNNGPAGTKIMRVDLENGSAINLTGAPFGGDYVELVRCPYSPDTTATSIKQEEGAIKQRSSIDQCSSRIKNMIKQRNAWSEQMRQRVNAEVMRTGNLSDDSACRNHRAGQAIDQKILAAAQACNSPEFSEKFRREWAARMANGRAIAARGGWCH